MRTHRRLLCCFLLGTSTLWACGGANRSTTTPQASESSKTPVSEDPLARWPALDAESAPAGLIVSAELIDWDRALDLFVSYAPEPYDWRAAFSELAKHRMAAGAPAKLIVTASVDDTGQPLVQWAISTTMGPAAMDERVEAGIDWDRAQSSGWISETKELEKLSCVEVAKQKKGELELVCANDTQQLRALAPFMARGELTSLHQQKYPEPSQFRLMVDVENGRRIFERKLESARVSVPAISGMIAMGLSDPKLASSTGELATSLANGALNLLDDTLRLDCSGGVNADRGMEGYCYATFRPAKTEILKFSANGTTPAAIPEAFWDLPSNVTQASFTHLVTGADPSYVHPIVGQVNAFILDGLDFIGAKKSAKSWKKHFASWTDTKKQIAAGPYYLAGSFLDRELRNQEAGPKIPAKEDFKEGNQIAAQFFVELIANQSYQTAVYDFPGDIKTYASLLDTAALMLKEIPSAAQKKWPDLVKPALKEYQSKGRKLPELKTIRSKSAEKLPRASKLYEFSFDMGSENIPSVQRFVLLIPAGERTTFMMAADRKALVSTAHEWLTHIKSNNKGQLRQHDSFPNAEGALVAPSGSSLLAGGFMSQPVSKSLLVGLLEQLEVPDANNWVEGSGDDILLQSVFRSFRYPITADGQYRVGFSAQIVPDTLRTATRLVYRTVQFASKSHSSQAAKPTAPADDLQDAFENAN